MIPISVITVVRNAEATIERCIRSVIAQGIPDLQYIVIDGCSTDGTPEILHRYSAAIDVLVSEVDSGLYDAMNKGLALARGRLIHFLNADDLYADSGALRRMLDAANVDAVYYGQMRYVDGDRVRCLGSPFSLAREIRKSTVPQPALFVPRQFYDEVGGFDLSLRIAADYDMVLRLARQYPVRFIPTVVTEMHAGGVSYSRPDLTFREAMAVSIRHGLHPGLARLLYWQRRARWALAGLFRGTSLPGGGHRDQR